MYYNTLKVLHISTAVRIFPCPKISSYEHLDLGDVKSQRYKIWSKYVNILQPLFRYQTRQLFIYVEKVF